jgi:hypothetical protein
MLRTLRAGAAAKITDALRKIMQNRGLAEHVATVVAFFYKMAGIVILLGVGLTDVIVITAMRAFRTNASSVGLDIACINRAIAVDAAKIELLRTFVRRAIYKCVAVATGTAAVHAILAMTEIMLAFRLTYRTYTIREMVIAKIYNRSRSILNVTIAAIAGIIHATIIFITHVRA